MLQLRYHFFFGLIALSFLLAISYALRHSDFASNVGSRNLEAPYHVLLTVHALNESSIQNHWLLPTVSLGRDQDKHIPWGATVPTASGDYIYTSFTPPGFLAPYLFFRVSGLEISLQNLAYFNLLLCVLSVFFLYSLVYKLLRYLGYESFVSAASSLAGSVVAIFSREALSSYGVTYWSQSLYQPILIATLYFLLNYLTSEKQRNTSQFALVLLAFIGALTEWTGYVFNIGLALILLFDKNWNKSSRMTSFYLFAVTVFAGLLTFMHYALAVGFKPAALAFVGRFLARSTAAGSLVELAQGYLLSYGFFLVLLGGISVYLGIQLFHQRLRICREPGAGSREPGAELL